MDICKSMDSKANENFHLFAKATNKSKEFRGNLSELGVNW